MTNSIRYSALILFLCAGIQADCFGLVHRTPERLTADAIAGWTGIYSREHGGKLPSAWNDLKTMFDVPLEELMSHSVPAKRYTFVSPPISLLPPHKGELVAINRSNIYDSTLETGFFGFTRGLKGPGRYMIFRTPSGKFETLWVLSDYVHQVFESAGGELPVADSEPERVWVTKARHAILTSRLIYGALIVGLLYFLWRRTRGRQVVEKLGGLNHSFIDNVGDSKTGSG